MKYHNQILKTSLILLSSIAFVACGGGSSDNEGSEEGTQEGMEGSNIPYLRENHANYSEHGSMETPAATKDANARTINWTISATTEEGAMKVAEHIRFMDARLKEDKNPRAFDKVFLMEAYMKYNNYYTTAVEQSGTTIVVSKQANTACAYEVISAHADVVSGDFFAQGILNIDHSSTGEAILASKACDAVRSDLTTYIAERQRKMGSM